MKSTILALALLPWVAAAFFQSPSSMVKTHADKLQAAPSLMMEVTVQPIGGAAETHRLVFSKPNLLNWDGPTQDVMTDGKTVWTYDQKTKTYTEESRENAALSLSGADPMIVWSAFFDPKFPEGFVGAKAGKARRIKTFGVKEVEVTDA
jgi:outer membrane lipoprotein-sorting protein